MGSTSGSPSAMERPHADALAKRGLSEQEVPAFSRPEVGRRQREYGHGIRRLAPREQIQDEPRQDLLVSRDRALSPRPSRDDLRIQAIEHPDGHAVKPSEQIGRGSDRDGMRRFKVAERLDIQRGPIARWAGRDRSPGTPGTFAPVRRTRITSRPCAESGSGHAAARSRRRPTRSPRACQSHSQAGRTCLVPRFVHDRAKRYGLRSIIPENATPAINWSDKKKPTEVRS